MDSTVPENNEEVPTRVSGMVLDEEEENDENVNQQQQNENPNPGTEIIQTNNNNSEKKQLQKSPNSFAIGDKIWFKWETEWWPAKIVPLEKATPQVKKEKSGDTLCLFYGSWDFAWLKMKDAPKKLQHFDAAYEKLKNSQKKQKFKDAVESALRDEHPPEMNAVSESESESEEEEEYKEEEEEKDDEEEHNSDTEKKPKPKKVKEAKPKTKKKDSSEKKKTTKKSTKDTKEKSTKDTKEKSTKDSKEKSPKDIKKVKESPKAKESSKVSSTDKTKTAPTPAKDVKKEKPATTTKPKEDSTKKTTPAPSSASAPKKRTANEFGEEEENEYEFGDEDKQKKNSNNSTPSKKSRPTSAVKEEKVKKPVEKPKEQITPESLKLVKDTLEEATKQNNTSVIIENLNRLTNCIVTPQSLEVSSIPSAIKPLRKHNNSEVSTLSTTLFNKWKQMCLEKEKEKTTTPAATNVSVKTVSPATPPTNTLKTLVKKEATKTSNSPTPSSSNSVKQEIPIPQELQLLNNDTRDFARKSFYQTLYLESSDKLGICKLAESIEIALYDLNGKKIDSKYNSSFRNLKENIKRNQHLRDNLVNGTIIPSKLVTMTPEELMTKEQRDEYQKNLKSKKDEARSDYYKEKSLNSSTGSIFKCKKCGSNKCDYEQKQTRSADEPMTVFVTCLNCDNRWKK